MKRYRVDFGYGRYYFEPNEAGDWVQFQDAQADSESTQNKITLLRAFLQAQVAQCKAPTPCQSCEALQTLLDATA
jgi:hypothetical protein